MNIFWFEIISLNKNTNFNRFYCKFIETIEKMRICIWSLGYDSNSIFWTYSDRGLNRTLMKNYLHLYLSWIAWNKNYHSPEPPLYLSRPSPSKTFTSSWPSSMSKPSVTSLKQPVKIKNHTATWSTSLESLSSLTTTSKKQINLSTFPSMQSLFWCPSNNSKSHISPPTLSMDFRSFRTHAVRSLTDLNLS